jgi:ABC-type nitrate/sulfonate/bicarbonate transport system permease component
MARDISSGAAFYHLYKTLLRVGFGLILTMLLGIGTGTIMGLSRNGEMFLDSWVMVGLTVPAIVYSIVCLLWFGLNEIAAIIAIGIAAFPPSASAYGKASRRWTCNWSAWARHFTSVRAPSSAKSFSLSCSRISSLQCDTRSVSAGKSAPRSN